MTANPGHPDLTDDGCETSQFVPPDTQPLLIDVKELSRLTSLSRRTIWRLVSGRRMPSPLKIGGRRLWTYESIVRWTQEGCPQIEP